MKWTLSIYLINNKHLDIAYSQLYISISEYIYGIYNIASHFKLKNTSLFKKWYLLQNLGTRSDVTRC